MNNNKAELAIVFLLLFVAALEIFSSQPAQDLVVAKHPVKALEAVDPRYPVMFGISGVLLLVLADFAPRTALWIALLIALGVFLRRFDYVWAGIQWAVGLIPTGLNPANLQRYQQGGQ